MKNSNDYKEGKEVLSIVGGVCEILYGVTGTTKQYYVTDKQAQAIQARCLESYQEAVTYACNYLGLIEKL
jgi:hypothetical protein